jgi:SulP family sulfate permease
MRILQLLALITILTANGVYGWTKPKPITERHGIKRQSPSRISKVSVQMSSESVMSKTSNFVKTKFSASERQKLVKAGTSGLAVSLAMVPEAVAFAFVAGVNPLVGLWTTVVLGFVAASLGGRPGICSSASGAVSVVIASLCKSHGPAYLSACAMVAGVLQILAGTLGLGKLIKLVPHPVMLGFVNGLAVVMAKAQMMHFKSGGKFMSLNDPLGAGTYGIAALTMVLVKLIPKLTKAIPPSLGAVVTTSVLAKVFSIPAKTLADVAGASTFAGGWAVLPKIGLPKVPMTMETFNIVLPYAVTMAAVGCLESLLTMQLLDGIVDDGTKGSGKKECFGQGSGNILSGLTGGIGGCALLGQSIINVQSGGGISRFSGMSMAIFLAIGIVAAAPLLASVPVASLVGVMLLVCQSTFSWSSLRLARKVPKLDVLVIALVSIITVQKDLAIAVFAGTVASALGFAYKQSTSLTGTFSQDDKEKTYKLNGPLFFGSTSQFDSIFTPKSDPSTVILDFSESRIMDHSAVDAIQNLSDKYADMGKNTLLQGLCSDSTRLLLRYCQGRKSPPFQFVGSEVDQSGHASVYNSLPL